MKRNFIVVLTLLLVLMVPLKALGKDIYVDPNWKKGYENTIWGETGANGRVVVSKEDQENYEKIISNQTPSETIKKENISVIVKGEEIAFKDAVPKIINNRVLVPMRSVFESKKVQCPVVWFNDQRSVVVFTPESECIVFTVDADKYQVIKADGTTIDRYLDSPAVIREDRVYLPLRDVFEYMGYYVTWNDTNKTVTINENTHDSSSFEAESTWSNYLANWYSSVKGGCVECVIKNYLNQ